MDVNNAYLYGDLNKEICWKLLPSYSSSRLIGYFIYVSLFMDCVRPLGIGSPNLPTLYDPTILHSYLLIIPYSHTRAVKIFL